jgi:hypothetical protein
MDSSGRSTSTHRVLPNAANRGAGRCYLPACLFRTQLHTRIPRRIARLEMIYSYRTHATDPDRNIRFHRYFGRSGEGLVWQTCENNDVRFFRRDDVADAKMAFHLRGSQASATREVFAVLSLPLRQLVGSSQAGATNAPIGVLSFDALSSEAADSLQDLFGHSTRAIIRNSPNWPTVLAFTSRNARCQRQQITQTVFGRLR